VNPVPGRNLNYIFLSFSINFARMLAPSGDKHVPKCHMFTIFGGLYLRNAWGEINKKTSIISISLYFTH
jgi:hypothetical protein